MADFAPQIVAGGSVFLLSVIFSCVFRIIRIMQQREDQATFDTEELRADLQWCGQHRAILISVVQRAGIEVPEVIWQTRPAPARRPKRRRRKGATNDSQ